ncbi:hypothetical protein C0995_004290 [Termitomyces sp. Mi166|nr:hypothetical protein C0995_004290 [Termitomyces sp. Mi166\
MSSIPIRPPEIVLKGDWDQSVDIWTFGCLVSQISRIFVSYADCWTDKVYTLATKGDLFKPMKLPKVGASEEDVLIFQMILFCGKFFEPPLLQRCRRSAEFFRKDCNLLKFDSLGYPLKPFKKCISDSGRLFSTKDMEGITDLMSKCLRLEPSKRATAEQLLEHPWLIYAALPNIARTALAGVPNPESPLTITSARFTTPVPVRRTKEISE